jgi:hypothetical protein
MIDDIEAGAMLKVDLLSPSRVHSSLCATTTRYFKQQSGYGPSRVAM